MVRCTASDINVRNVCDEHCVFVLQNKKDKGVVNGMVISKLGMGLTWIMILEKLVKMSPSDKDDILLDVIWQGLSKMVKGESK